MWEWGSCSTSISIEDALNTIAQSGKTQNTGPSFELAHGCHMKTVCFYDSSCNDLQDAVKPIPSLQQHLFKTKDHSSMSHQVVCYVWWLRRGSQVLTWGEVYSGIGGGCIWIHAFVTSGNTDPRFQPTHHAFPIHTFSNPFPLLHFLKRIPLNMK